MLGVIALAGLIVAVIWAFGRRTGSGTQGGTSHADVPEPPVLRSNIPIIGHLIGMFRHGQDYWRHLHSQHGLGLFTLPTFGSKKRLYVAMSAEWITAADKRYDTMGLHGLLDAALPRLYDLKKGSVQALRRQKEYPNGKNQDLIDAVAGTVRRRLGPSGDLEKLLDSTLSAVASRVNSANFDGQQVALWEWVRHNFLAGASNAFYGPNNIFDKDPRLVDDFWNFIDNVGVYLFYPFPRWTAPGPYKSRARIQQALKEYVAGGGFSEASELIKERHHMHSEAPWFLDPDEWALGDLSMLVALGGNTTPALFWLLSHIYADRDLLDGLRKEVDGFIRRENGDAKATIDMHGLVASPCTLLRSTIKEVLRMTASLVLSREISADTLVTDKVTGQTYLLTKGSMMQQMTSVVHYNPQIYDDPLAFNAYRFVDKRVERRDATGAQPEQQYRTNLIYDPGAASSNKASAGSFRAFAGGQAICPGRFFAHTELLALVALFVAGFDMTMAGKNGEPEEPVQVPPQKKLSAMIVLFVVQPQHDIDVRIRPRQGFEDTAWAFGPMAGTAASTQ